MSKQPIVLYLLGSLLFGMVACNEPGTSSEQTAGNAPMIALSGEETGIDFANVLTETAGLNIIEYLYYYNGGGVAIGDIDNDGLEDVYFTANQGPDKLYLNKGDLYFEDITQRANILQDNTWSSGVAMADINGDGYLDIYVCKVGVGKLPAAYNLVYINQKDGTFAEQSETLGLRFQGFSTQAAFLDYDKDGDLDIYLLNHNVHSVRSYGNTDKRTQDDPFAGDRFYENRLNEAEQKFVEVTEEVGIYNSPLGYGLAVTCADVNGDGWTDIYVGNDFHENDYLYINNGDGTFREEIDEWTDHTTQFSMGVDIADLNNDQLPDIFTTDMLPFDEEIYLKSGGEDTDQIKRIKDDLGFEEQFARNHLQLNTGQGNFLDIALQTRTFATDWSWAVLLQDFDNNGRKDIYITNGIAKRPNDLDYINYLNSEAISGYQADNPERTQKLIEKLPSQPLRNVLFLQTDDLTFTDIGSSQLSAPSFSNGAAYADLDQDGILEVVVNNINAPATIWKCSGAKGSYLNVQLVDPSGRTTLGTKVKAYAGGTVYTQELQRVKGYQSSSSHQLHFGLGDVAQVDSIVVIWPDFTQQLLAQVAVNTNQTITKDSPTNTQLLAASSPTPPMANTFPVRHQENDYNDDEYEKLIPEKLTREGPAVLYEDLDGDGIKDLLLGGAHSAPTQLLKGQADGTFVSQEVAAFTQDIIYEDVAVASIDFDNDGDRDLYISSGGSAAKELDKRLEDRLYLNNGEMDFRRIPISLPHTNGSVVAVADYDGDGFEDIFVGARSMPGYYGLSPYSFLLKNRSGTGLDMELKHRFGLLTDAQWADYDGDDDLDLLMCGDWMPITIIENKGDGELEYLPEEAGFPQNAGFWNNITLTDLNQDGKLDILAGNLGKNSLLNATEEHPTEIYLGDFDENGTVDPLVFFYYFDRYVLLGSKDKYVAQLPSIKKQFVDYESFAAVSSFAELIPEGEEQVVENNKVDELRSMLFLSLADGYEAIPLPSELQRHPIEDIVVDPATQYIYYLGGTQELVAARGNAMSTQLGVLGAFDASTKQFQQNVKMRLPTGINGRTIVPLQNGKGLVIANNGYPYWINLLEKTVQ